MAKLFVGGGSIDKIHIEGNQIQFTISAQTKAKKAEAEIEFEIAFKDGEKRTVRNKLELKRRKDNCCLVYNETYEKEIEKISKFTGNIHKTSK